MRRVIAGYWTHAGYLNWDTGFGFERWHQAKKLGLSAQALIGLASSDTLNLEPRWRAWAKDILDEGLRFYERQSERAGGVPPALDVATLDALTGGDVFRAAGLKAGAHMCTLASPQAAPVYEGGLREVARRPASRNASDGSTSAMTRSFRGVQRTARPSIGPQAQRRS